MIIIYGFLMIMNIALVNLTRSRFTATMSAAIATLWGIVFGMKLAEYL